jgi:hypothetical protein
MVSVHSRMSDNTRYTKTKSYKALLPGTRMCRFIYRVLAILFILIFDTAHLRAQSISPDSLTAEKIQCISTMLVQGKPAANTWWYGWLAAYSVATIAQSAVAVKSGELKTRQDMVLSAGTTLLGAAGQLLTPMVPGYAPGRLAQFPERTAEERALKLVAAEDLLRLSAEREKTGRSWKSHAICSAVNLGSGLITWVGYNRNIWAGLGNFALNTAITEAQIWSQPTKAIRDYRHYCKKYKPGPNTTTLNPGMSWYVSAYPGGISIRLVF